MALLSSARSRAGGVFHGRGRPMGETVSLCGGDEKEQGQQHNNGALGSPVDACSHRRASSFGLGLGVGAGHFGFDAPWLIEILLHRRQLHTGVDGCSGKVEGEGVVNEKTTPLRDSNGQDSTAYDVRKATEEDVPFLGDIERSAGEVFRQVGLDAVADDEPMPEEVLRGYTNAGQVWVAVAGGGVVVGFLACFPIAHQDNSQLSNLDNDGPEMNAFLHIAELSVHAAHQQRGLGRRLLDAMFSEVTAQPSVLATGFTGDERWKRGARVLVRGFSLTTYRHLAFNKPFYERRGFRELAVGEIEGLVGRRGRELWEEEQAGILRPEMRCWMVRDL